MPVREVASFCEGESEGFAVTSTATPFLGPSLCEFSSGGVKAAG